MAHGTKITPGPGGWEEQEAVFSEPWQARIFAIAVALSQQGYFSFEEFRPHLIARINGPEASSEYYFNWMAALEDLLAEKHLLADREIRAAMAELAAAAQNK